MYRKLNILSLIEITIEFHKAVKTKNLTATRSQFIKTSKTEIPPPQQLRERCKSPAQFTLIVFLPLSQAFFPLKSLLHALKDEPPTRAPLPRVCSKKPGEKKGAGWLHPHIHTRRCSGAAVYRRGVRTEREREGASCCALPLGCCCCCWVDGDQYPLLPGTRTREAEVYRPDDGGMCADVCIYRGRRPSCSSLACKRGA